MTEIGERETDANRGIMIDAPDTLDRDDALWVRRDDAGYDAWVHVALVADRLPTGTAGDAQARRRTQTRYLPDHTIGMLPHDVERAATLAQGQTQDTMGVAMRFTTDGQLVESVIGRAKLHRPTALSYAQAAEALDDSHNELHQALIQAHALATTLLNRRQNAGALVLYDLFKGYATNEEGQLVKLGDNQRNAGYIIVQELMIAANTAIALWCAERDLPILFRNHRAAAVGGTRNDLLEELTTTETRGDSAAYETLRQRLTIVQRPATYDAAVFGHFGLNLPAYTHATSPLRRYSDLVNQRVLMAAASSAPQDYDREALVQLSAELNDYQQRQRERRSQRHKLAARRATREHLEGCEFSDLDTQQFSKVLNLALEQDEPPPALVDEARQRNENRTLPLRDACEIVFSGAPGTWGAIRDTINRELAAEPTKALTLVNMRAQAMLGGPVSDAHLVWEVNSVGTAHQSAFAARLSLELGEYRRSSPQRIQPSKKDAKAQTALALVAEMAGLDDLSDTIDVPEPVEADFAGTKVPSDRHPVMAVNEYAQTGVISELAWEFHHSGPAHEPVFTCTVTAKADTGERLSAVGNGPGKQIAKSAAAQRLRIDIESSFASDDQSW